MSVSVEHWFDFTCPYCYLAQDRNRILDGHGITVIEYGLQIHPEIGPGGTPAGPRVGPQYEFLAREAEAAGLPLHWQDRIAYSRTALAAYQWLRETHPEVAEPFATAVFTAYFADGQDIESVELLVKLAGVDELREALTSTAADEALRRSEARAREYGVNSTPTWVIGGQVVSGLRSRAWFDELAGALLG